MNIFEKGYALGSIALGVGICTYANLPLVACITVGPALGIASGYIGIKLMERVDATWEKSFPRTPPCKNGCGTKYKLEHVTGIGVTHKCQTCGQTYRLGKNEFNLIEEGHQKPYMKKKRSKWTGT